ncbi:hypothetical protein LINPERPRIM_LOCUS2079 [Linum perenne]
MDGLYPITQPAQSNIQFHSTLIPNCSSQQPATSPPTPRHSPSTPRHSPSPSSTNNEQRPSPSSSPSSLNLAVAQLVESYRCPAR